MNAIKPLSLAVAVASASYVGMINAQELAGNTGLGDLAIVPYYTVNEAWSTGISVINTSPETQVIKIRMRRAVDSMDALDFNVVLSPFDVWTGYAQEVDELDETGAAAIRWFTNDDSCTVPALTNNYLQMPGIYREGSESGYIEVIAMGAADVFQPISKGALHDEDGIPFDCDKVRENFKRGQTADDYADTYPELPSYPTRRQGVVNSSLTVQSHAPTGLDPSLFKTSAYTNSENVLKVSYFIRDDDSGTEFGNDAVHIADFMDGASITNQRQGINEGDLQGFDHPNLNGGAPTSWLAGFGADSAESGIGYEPLRDLLGADNVINDWSANDTDLFDVNTDWVVTTPGQYLMTRLNVYIDSLEPGGDPCFGGDPANDYVDDEDADDYGDNCDFRDIPLQVSATVWSREEELIEATPDDLVVSPAPPTEPAVVQFDREVNVVSWGTETVINEDKSVVIPVPAGAFAGWARVSVTQWTGTDQGICFFTNWGTGLTADDVECDETFSPPPLVGFVAWERSFSDQPASNFGRIVEHSYGESILP
jgi:hypothetical protein